MKTVKYSGIVFLIACCCISCKETIYEKQQIVIQNRTDSLIHITLFPKGTIIGMTYLPCEGKNCGGKSMEFVLHPNNNEYNDWNEVIFSSCDLKIDPYILASKAFDSIHISTANAILKFTHEKVTGYSENIFSENSTWDFDIREGYEETWFSSNPYRNYIYKFLISKDKVIIE